jgi:hypothetical protein
MNRLRTRAPGNLDNGGNMQVTLRSLRRANMIRLIGHAHMQSVAINIAIHSNTGQAKFATGTYHTYRNLAAIGNQYLRKRPAGYGVCMHGNAPFDCCIIADCCQINNPLPLMSQLLDWCRKSIFYPISIGKSGYQQQQAVLFFSKIR